MLSYTFYKLTKSHTLQKAKLALFQQVKDIAGMKTNGESVSGVGGGRGKQKEKT